MDVNSGDAIHIDFNCLFERVGSDSLHFMTYTKDLGIAGQTVGCSRESSISPHSKHDGGLWRHRMRGCVESEVQRRKHADGLPGPFRIACEISVRLFRANKESLMSVLDAFLHDPLVEWETDRRKLVRENSSRSRLPG